MNFRFRYSILSYDIGKLMNSCRFVEAFAYFGIKNQTQNPWFFSKTRESPDGLYSAVEWCWGTLWDQKWTPRSLVMFILKNRKCLDLTFRKVGEFLGSKIFLKSILTILSNQMIGTGMNIVRGRRCAERCSTHLFIPSMIKDSKK